MGNSKSQPAAERLAAGLPAAPTAEMPQQASSKGMTATAAKPTIELPADVTTSAMQAAPTPTPRTMKIYDKLGGKEAIQAAVDIFYAKILADDSINGFFKNTDMKEQRSKQMLFMCYALGGPQSWKGKNMYEAHKALNLKEEHFNAVAGHFIATLKELNVPQDVIDEAVAVVASTKNQVLGLEKPDGPVEQSKCPFKHE
jgi:hemoglobin